MNGKTVSRFPDQGKGIERRLRSLSLLSQYGRRHTWLPPSPDPPNSGSQRRRTEEDPVPGTGQSRIRDALGEIEIQQRQYVKGGLYSGYNLRDNGIAY